MTSDSIHPQKIIAAVLAVTINKQAKFLLTRRHAPKYKAWHNKWQFPGGAFEFGETPQKALTREMQEELKVNPRIIYPYPIVKTSTWYGKEIDTKQDSHIILICYLTDIGSQTIDTSGDDETNKFGWFTKLQALKLDYLPLTNKILIQAEKLIKNHHLLSVLQ